MNHENKWRIKAKLVPPEQLLWEIAEDRGMLETLNRLKRAEIYEGWRQMMLCRICTKSVRERLGGIRLVNPNFAYRLEDLIIEGYVSGKVQFVNFGVFREIVRYALKGKVAK